MKWAIFLQTQISQIESVACRVQNLENAFLSNERKSRKRNLDEFAERHCMYSKSIRFISKYTRAD